MSDPEEPKIIVDEDWKSQVENEKEALRQQEAATSESEPAHSDSHGIPEASFQVLLATLATQAMAMLGLLGDVDGSGAPQTNLPMARHLIDMIAVLDEKTKGNLTSEESTALNENLHQLRMAFLAVSQNQGGSAATDEAPAKSSIELP